MRRVFFKRIASMNTHIVPELFRIQKDWRQIAKEARGNLKAPHVNIMRHKNMETSLLVISVRSKALEEGGTIVIFCLHVAYLRTIGMGIFHALVAVCCFHSVGPDLDPNCL